MTTAEVAEHYTATDQTTWRRTWRHIWKYRLQPVWMRSVK